MPPDFDPDAPATGDGLFGLPHTVDEARVVVLPVPFEATTSYRRGTAGAPAAVLEASHQVDLCDLQTGEPWRAGIAMAPIDPDLIALNAQATADADRARAHDEAGETEALAAAVAQVDAAGAQVNERVYAWTRDQLAAGRIPGILGGDHAVPLGAMQAAAAQHPGLGILHVDAHADLRDAYEGFAWSHASILHNVLDTPEVGPVVQVGIRDLGYAELRRAREESRIFAWSDVVIGESLATGRNFKDLVDAMLEPLPDKVWITFDIDGLDPALCPGTGTPVPGGLSWREALTLLSALGRSGRTIVGFDLCEVGPGSWDANVGARLLYKLAGWAIASQPNA